MKTFKIWDAWISTGLIISFVIINIIELHQGVNSNYLFAAYFTVGGWQVISMIIHAVTRTFTYKWGARYNYQWITFIAVVTMPGSFWVLIFSAPFLAIFYTWLCFNEVYVKMQRPLSVLK